MKNLFQFIEDQTHFKHILTYQNEFDPQRTNIECTAPFTPPHYPQACTKNLPIVEGVVCKKTNSKPKVMLSYEDNCVVKL